MYQKDFLKLVEIVNTSHPANDSLKNILTDFANSTLQELKSCNSTDDFEILAQQFLALLNDGHSSIYCGYAYSRKGYYPIQFKVKNGDFYISNYSRDIPPKLIGSKIKSINNTSIDSIVLRARKLISFDNEVGLFEALRYEIKKPSFLELVGIEANTQLVIELADNEKSEFIWDRNLQTGIYTVKFGGTTIQPDVKKLKYHKEKENKLTGWSGQLFEYEIIDDYSTCYFKFSECFDIQYLNANRDYFKPLPVWFVKFFWYFRGGNFSKFLSKMFSKIEAKEIDNLVIDLRQNRGGTSILGYQLIDYLTDLNNLKDYEETLQLSTLLQNNHLEYFNEVVIKNGIDTADLKLPITISSDSNPNKSIAKYLRERSSPYFQQEPKKKFEGNVYVLVGGLTFSSAAMIAVLMADNKLATIVGNQISSNPTHFGEVLKFELENTGARGSLSCKKFYRPAYKKKKNKLKIDMRVTNSVKESFNGIDSEFEKLLHEIKGY